MDEYDEFLDLTKYTKSQLFNMAQEEGIEINSSMTKDELIELLEEYYDQESEPDNFEPEQEDDDEPVSIFDRERPVDGENDMSNLDDDDITSNTDVYDKLLNPHIIVRLIRKRILYEKYNPITKKFIRVSQKRPLASKGFVSRFEVRVLSFTNLNFYESNMDYEKDIIPFAKSNLHNFNDELLHAKEINESTHMIFYDIFYNLLKAAVKNAQDGRFQEHIENLRANKTTREIDNDRMQMQYNNQPSLRDEFVGAHN